MTRARVRRTRPPGPAPPNCEASGKKASGRSDVLLSTIGRPERRFQEPPRAAMVVTGPFARRAAARAPVSCYAHSRLPMTACMLVIVVEPPADANESTLSGQATLSTMVFRIYWMLIRVHEYVVCREQAENNRKEH